MIAISEAQVFRFETFIALVEIFPRTEKNKKIPLEFSTKKFFASLD